MGWSVVYSAFYADFCLCPKLVITTTLKRGKKKKGDKRNTITETIHPVPAASTALCYCSVLTEWQLCRPWSEQAGLVLHCLSRRSIRKLMVFTVDVLTWISSGTITLFCFNEKKQSRMKYPKARFHVPVITHIKKCVVYFTVRRNVKFWRSECWSVY